MTKKPASQQRKAFAMRLRARREEKGFKTAADFAVKLGVEKPTYRKWERGGAEPGIADLAKLQRALEVSLDWLIAGSVPAQASPPGFRDADDRRDGYYAG